MTLRMESGLVYAVFLVNLEEIVVNEGTKICIRYYAINLPC